MPRARNQEPHPNHGEAIASIRRSGVPNSCIESAEYIIRKIYRGPAYTWTPAIDGAPTENPHVYAVFGGNWYFDISDDEGWLDSLPEDLADYPFGSRELPGIGEGLCLVKKTPGPNQACDYDMHFGAVLSGNAFSVEISDNCEPPGDVVFGALKKTRITRPGGFRKTIAGASKTHFALGKLTVNLPNGARKIRIA